MESFSFMFSYTAHIFTVDIIFFMHLSLEEERNPLFLFRVPDSEGLI